MYEKCLAHYQRTAKGLSATLVKRERVNGEPLPAAGRGDPARGPRRRAGPRDWQARDRGRDAVAVRGAEGHAVRDPRHPLQREARPGRDQQPCRFVPPDALVTTTSLNPADRWRRRSRGTASATPASTAGCSVPTDAWKQRQAAGTLKTELRREAGDRGSRRAGVPRHRPHRGVPEADPFELGGPPVTDPEVIARDGFTRVRVMIDAETWMQVGSELYRPDGTLLASYYFRNVDHEPVVRPRHVHRRRAQSQEVTDVHHAGSGRAGGVVGSAPVTRHISLTDWRCDRITKVRSTASLVSEVSSAV
jgi:hypothetical protein